MTIVKFVPTVDLVNGLIHGVRRTYGEVRRSVPLLNNRADSFRWPSVGETLQAVFICTSLSYLTVCPLVGGMTPGGPAPRWWGFLKYFAFF